MENNKPIDYSTVTETPDDKASEEQLNRLYTRYRFAREFCDGKDVYISGHYYNDVGIQPCY